MEGNRSGSMNGKTAIITGASRGIGKAIALKLASAGCNIAIAAKTVEAHPKLEGTIYSAAEEIEKSGGKALPLQVDIRHEEQIIAAVQETIERFGGIDILVNNAGVIMRVPAMDMDPEDFRKVVDVDLVSPFILSQRVAKTMRSIGGGKIINICSMMSELGRDTVSAYAAAKGGLKMLTKNLATEWAQYNIQVNGIGPGYFATDQTAPIRVEGHPFNDFIVNRTPAGRWGDPEDLAGATIFLASKASDFVNGQIIYVDGGLLATIGKPY